MLLTISYNAITYNCDGYTRKIKKKPSCWDQEGHIIGRPSDSFHVKTIKILFQLCNNCNYNDQEPKINKITFDKKVIHYYLIFSFDYLLISCFLVLFKYLYWKIHNQLIVLWFVCWFLLKTNTCMSVLTTIGLHFFIYIF